jgi:uncharacterized protein YycO
MRILGYKGVSAVSRIIKFQTRSPYSHIGVRLKDGSVIEAWAEGFFGGSVRQIEQPMTGHSLGTVIDVFRIDCHFNEAIVEAYLIKQMGQAYDYRMVSRFLSRRRAKSNEAIFCSELAELAFLADGVKLLNGNPSEHSPRDTLLSPFLIYESTIK